MMMMMFTDLKIMLNLNIDMIIMNIIPILMHFIEKVSVVQEETNILQEFMEEEIDDIVNSLDEKDDEESEEQMNEERISYPCPPSNASNYIQLIHYLMPLRSYRRMNAIMISMILLIRLKYPFLRN